MAVYRYFQDKEALVEGLVDAAADSVELPARRGSWRTRMKALLRDTREALRRPSGELATTRPGNERLARAGLGLLAEAGLRQAEAATAWRALFGYAVGFPAVGDDERDDFDYGLERLLDGIESRT
jgi:AcrR family transcriptional regulator